MKKCKKHPKYFGKKSPTSDCIFCHDIYNEVNPPTLIESVEKVCKFLDGEYKYCGIPFYTLKRLDIALNNEKKTRKRRT
jgi:hypothetical protein